MNRFIYAFNYVLLEEFNNWYIRVPRAVDINQFVMIDNVELTLGTFIDFFAMKGINFAVNSRGYRTYNDTHFWFDTNHKLEIIVPIASKDYNDNRLVLLVWEECILHTIKTITNPLQIPF